MSEAPSIVPSDDQDTYLVLDDFGGSGLAWRETDVNRATLEAVIADLMDDQYSNPVRVISFNIAEGWVATSQKIPRASCAGGAPIKAASCRPICRISSTVMIITGATARNSPDNLRASGARGTFHL